MHSEAVGRRHIWNNLPLHFKGLMLVLIPLPALLVAAAVLSGDLREERQAIASAESLTAARRRLQDISSVLRVPGSPAQNYRALASLAKDLGPVSSEPDRRRETEAAIQQKLDSLAALSATLTPAESLLKIDRQSTESLQSYVSAQSLEHNQLLSSELNRVKAARAKVFALCFKGAFIFVLSELLAALVFLGAVAGQVRALKRNARRLAQGLALEPLFTDNWELNQIGQDLVRASAELARCKRELEATGGPAPDPQPAEQLDLEHRESMIAQLRERNEQLAESVTAAREALAAKRHFLAKLSRELRVPLSSILGFSELLYDGKLGSVTEQQKGCLSDVLAGSRRILQLADSVVAAAGPASTPATSSCDLIDLENLLREVIFSLAPDARKKGMRMESDVDPSLCRVRAGREDLRHLLEQHIANAIQLTPHDALLEVRLRPENNKAVRLEAHITGLGLPVQDVVRLFPEFRATAAPAEQAEQEPAGAQGEPDVFYAILPGVTRQTEPAVRARNVGSRSASASMLVH